MMFKKAAILAIATLTLFSSCSKNGSSSLLPPDTKLKLTVTDNLGAPMSGATVILYYSQTDFENDANRLATMTSDGSGTVTFSSLSAHKYFWSAEKGCLTNMLGTVTTVTSLNANVTNTATTSLSGAGSLKFVNSSSNPYRI